uniref:Uncharacterized protein n=1 Tax=Rhizophora mucronata TaxID=61149 RepID=A0A2P2MNL4_RHIMU
MRCLGWLGSLKPFDGFTLCYLKSFALHDLYVHLFIYILLPWYE